MADPFSWSRDFAANQQQRANQHEANYNNALMSVFQEEAARQRPYAVMPAQLAANEFERRNAQPYADAENEAAMRRWYTQKDYEQEQQMELIRLRDELKQDDPTTGGGGLPDGNWPQPDGSIQVVQGGQVVKIIPPTR